MVPSIENSALLLLMGNSWPSHKAQFRGAKLPANRRTSPIIPSIPPEFDDDVVVVVDVEEPDELPELPVFVLAVPA